MLLSLFFMVGLLCVLCAIRSISPNVFERLIINKEKVRKAKNSDYIFIVSSFIGWMIIFFGGFYNLLTIIPDSIGGINFDGE